MIFKMSPFLNPSLSLLDRSASSKIFLLFQEVLSKTMKITSVQTRVDANLLFFLGTSSGTADFRDFTGKTADNIRLWSLNRCDIVCTPKDPNSGSRSCTRCIHSRSSSTSDSLLDRSASSKIFLLFQEVLSKTMKITLFCRPTSLLYLQVLQNLYNFHFRHLIPT